MANQPTNEGRQPQQQAGGRQMDQKGKTSSNQSGKSKQTDPNQQRRDRH